MWQREDINVPVDNKLQDEYINIIKKSKIGNESNIYLYFQIMFMTVMIVVSFVLKNGGNDTFEFAKDNYKQIFEKDNFAESTFSYKTFIEEMQNELQYRYGQLISVFNNLNSQGSADIYPDNVSTEKIIISEKGVLPAKGYISSPYGIRKNPFNSKEKEFHTGIDIASAKGTFIKSAFDGTVISAGSNNIAGNFVRIQSSDNIVTLYAHNQFLLVKTGDKVIAGQVIATMGDTGMTTGPHLHFEFIYNGTRYNPVYAINI
ncbi:MAG: M23 family metallopeptidase [Ruminococcaceae bacterium]|nr:M23 family metallopeptidase [Oscillospiraceae bacterium]